MKPGIVFAPLLLFALFFAAFGQSGSGRPVFDAASVKRTPPSEQGKLRMDYCSAGGRYLVEGTPVMWSLKHAFQVKDYQVAGAPAWLDAFDSAYNIEARPAEPVDKAQCRLMLQSLFTDRFRLVAHREMKEAPVYFLTIGKNGAKIHEGGQVRFNRSIEVDASGTPSYPDGWTMAQLAVRLSDYAGRPVLDKTELTAKYGIVLEFSRGDGDNGPDIFTAVQDQLGLRLEAGKAPIEMLVIDHIEKPSEN